METNMTTKELLTNLRRRADHNNERITIFKNEWEHIESILCSAVSHDNIISFFEGTDEKED